jgi:hypothetical protein
MVAMNAHGNTTWIRAALLIALIGIPVSASAADRCDVSVRVTNGHARTVRVAPGPVDLMAEVRVPPHAQNRALDIIWDFAERASFGDFDAFENGMFEGFRNTYEGAIGSAEMSLDGDRERTLHQRTMNGLSGGEYEVKATVYRDAAKKQPCGTATATVRVLGVGR